MCGIAGFTRYQLTNCNIDTLKQMGQAIYHRGPDAGGEYLDNDVGLCHRRLSIIDLSEAGNQPMYSQDGEIVIVFNGEIYNFQELREELAKEGYAFKTHTDTEVLIALYQRDGTDLLHHINGMFAFAIWDKREQSLFLARDRLGKKPLYYYSNNGQFAFASELKSLLKIDQIPRKIRPDAVRDFFAYQYVPDPKSIFENIYKLEPGHYLTIKNQQITKEQYWNLSFQHTNNLNEDDNAKALLEEVNKATKSRMIADVPLGAFLSGGVDSSAIVALMANNSSDPVTTCAIGFDSKEFDEVEFAKLVADQYKTKHHELTVKDNVADNIEKIVEFFDEPFADPSLIPTYFVSQLAREKVTVALAGDGGDESFAGYQKYAVDEVENRLRSSIPKFVRKHILAKALPLIPSTSRFKLNKVRTLIQTLSAEPDYGFYLTNSFFREHLWNDSVLQTFSKELDGYHPSEITQQHYHDCDSDDHLAKILYSDFKTYLPGDILVKVDRMSMANSLEVRAPILDYKVVEFAASIPSDLKLHKGEKKHILKEAFKGRLSDTTLYRKKMGFSVPLADWLRNEIKQQAEQIIFDSPAGLRNYFQMEKVRQLWDRHQTSQENYASELWSMLMFQMWYNKYANS